MGRNDWHAWECSVGWLQGLLDAATDAGDEAGIDAAVFALEVMDYVAAITLASMKAANRLEA